MALWYHDIVGMKHGHSCTLYRPISTVPYIYSMNTQAMYYNVVVMAYVHVYIPQNGNLAFKFTIHNSEIKLHMKRNEEPLK